MKARRDTTEKKKETVASGAPKQPQRVAIKAPIKRFSSSSNQLTVVRRNSTQNWYANSIFQFKESAIGLEDKLPIPSHLGKNLGESLRLGALISRKSLDTVVRTRVFSWGYGFDGALGTTGTHRVREMRNVSLFRRDFLQEVSAGNRLSLFLTNKGILYQSGRLYMKQGGRTMWHPTKIQEYLLEPPPIIEQPAQTPHDNHKVEEQTKKPAEQLEAVINPPPRIVAVEAGHMSCYVLSDQGEVYSWGSALFGQLGLEGINELQTAYAVAPSPKKIKSNPRGSNQEDKKDSEEDEGEDELNDEEDDEETSEADKFEGKRVLVLKKPILLKTLTQWKITKVRAGNHYALAVSSTGKAFSWGRNTSGQLGIGHTQDTSVPTLIESLHHHFCVEISAGYAHVVGIFASSPQFNKVFSWGRGLNGCLGLGGTKDEMLPREVTFFCGLNATQVAAGSDHSLVLCSCGSQTFVYAFGGNIFGQLGVGSTNDHIEMPHYLDELGNKRIASIGAGARYSVALTTLGELFTWGDAMYGKTNQPANRTTIVPWRVDTFTDHFVSQVSVGQHHALGVMRDSCEGIDRWRKFSLNDIIVPFLEMDEGKVDIGGMTCESTHIQSTHTFFSIHLTCETCGMKGPICRVCTRRCHKGHVLTPTVLGSSRNSCVCGQQQKEHTTGSPQVRNCLAVVPEPIPEEK